MCAKKVSGKTHTKQQLDNWANQHNPNNSAYIGNAAKQSNILSSKRKSHQQEHNARRRYNAIVSADVYWMPEYPWEIED